MKLSDSDRELVLLLIFTLLICVPVHLFYALNDIYQWIYIPGLYDDAVNKSPMKPRPRTNRANFLMKDGHLDEALTEFQNVIALSFQPHLPEIEQRRARQFGRANVIAILMQTNQWQSAMDEASKLWREYPGHPAAGVTIAFIANAGGATDYALQILDLVEAARNRNEYTWFHVEGEIHLYRGDAYRIQGDCVKAEAEYAIARRESPWMQDIPACVPPEPAMSY